MKKILTLSAALIVSGTFAMAQDASAPKQETKKATKKPATNTPVPAAANPNLSSNAQMSHPTTQPASARPTDKPVQSKAK